MPCGSGPSTASIMARCSRFSCVWAPGGGWVRGWVGGPKRPSAFRVLRMRCHNAMPCRNVVDALQGHR